APEDVDVALSVNWPDDLKEKGLWLLCNFSTASRRIGPETWNSFSRTPFNAMRGMGMGGAGNGMINIGETLLVKSDGGLGAAAAKTYRQDPNPETIEFIAPSQFEATHRFPALTYRLATSWIVAPNRRDGDRYYVLARAPSAAMGGMGGGMMGGMGGGFFNI